MSTAAAFNAFGPFPFCVADVSGNAALTTFDFVGNLSMSSVMAFYWNLESFSISSGGTASDGVNTVNATTTAVLNPVTSSTPYTTGYSGGAWYDQASSVNLSSFAAIKVPRSRVCNPLAVSEAFPDIGFIAMQATNNFFQIRFVVSQDPSNAGKFRLYYELIHENISGAVELDFYNPANNSGAVLSSGTFSIDSITMNWEATDQGTSTSHSGISFSATSSSYTY